MTLATTISIILVLVGFVSAWIKRKYTFWKSQNILTPPYKIGWGHFKQPILQTLSFPETICLYYRYFKSKKVKHGGLYSYFFPIYMPIDLDIIKAILLTDFDHFAHRGFYRNEVDDSLTATIFSLDEDKWKWIRPKISAGYTSAKLKVMYDTIMKCAEEFNHFLGDADRDEVNMKEIVENYTMNIVGYCVFGLKCNCFEESDNEFIKYGEIYCFLILENVYTFCVRFENGYFNQFCMSNKVYYSCDNKYFRNRYINCLVFSNNSTLFKIYKITNAKVIRIS